MSAEERIAELEATLKDIIVGCDMMLQISLCGSFKSYVLEVKRVASAPLAEVAS